jgi:hypothetical protein
MSDEKSTTGPQHAQRVNIHEDCYEVRYWCQRSGVPKPSSAQRFRKST